jgi:hypothetical protein
LSFCKGNPQAWLGMLWLVEQGAYLMLLMRV